MPGMLAVALIGCYGPGKRSLTHDNREGECMTDYAVSVGNRGCVADHCNESEARQVFEHYCRLAWGENTTVYLYHGNTLIQATAV